MSENFGATKKVISEMHDYLKSIGFYEKSRDEQLVFLYEVLNSKKSRLNADIARLKSEDGSVAPIDKLNLSNFERELSEISDEINAIVREYATIESKQGGRGK